MYQLNSPTSYIFLLHFDICNSCLKFSENFMIICEKVNEIFENGNTHCNTVYTNGVDVLQGQ